MAELLIPPVGTIAPISDQQRHAAAQTIAELAAPEHVGYYLKLLGLAEERDGQLHAVVGDREDMTWWRAVRPLSARLGRGLVRGGASRTP